MTSSAEPPIQRCSSSVRQRVEHKRPAWLWGLVLLRFDDLVHETAARFLLIPAALDRDLRHSGVHFTEIIRCEFDRNSPDVLVKALKLPAAGDRHDPRLLCEQPGQRDLRRRRTFLSADPSEQVNHNLIGFDRFWCKAWIAAADIGA